MRRLQAVKDLQASLVTLLHRSMIDQFRSGEREQLDGRTEEPAIRAAVEQLDPELREVFVLHAFERRSYEEISLALGIPLNTVGTRLLRARRKLRVLLLGGSEEVDT